ncbi:MAG: DUF192 domain-containing protein [Candidatus Micrarchaeia archaeon]
MIGGEKLELFVADSFTKKAIGLMYRDTIGKKEGMLFKFDKEGYYSIWMHNMLFSIDIFWVDSSGNIVDMVKDAKPCEKFMGLGCKVYKPKEKSMYVIETASGFAGAASISIGDKVSFA